VALFVDADTLSGNTTFVYKDERVGVGTTGVDRKLHIDDGVTTVLTPALKLSNSNDGGGTGTGIEFATADGDYSKAAIYFINDGSGFGKGDLSIAIDNVGDTNDVTTGDTVITIQHEGNVGIGTMAPAKKLHVSGGTIGLENGSSNALEFKNNAGSFNGAKIYTNTADAIRIESEGNLNYILGDDGSGTVSDVRNKSEDVLFRVAGDGQVSVNSTSTPCQFYVYQSGDTTNGAVNGITIEQGGLADCVLQFLLTSGQRWVTGIDNSDSDKFKLATSANVGTDTVLTVDTSGNVGIGTDSPDRHVEINPVSTNDGLFINLGVGATGNYGGVWFKSTATSPGYQHGAILWEDDGSAGAGGKLHLANNSDIGNSTNVTTGLTSVALTVNGTRDVGIGIKEPVSKLHVYQDTTDTGTGAGLTIEQDGNGDLVTQYVSTGVKTWVTGLATNGKEGSFNIASSTNIQTDVQLTITDTGQLTVPDTITGVDALRKDIDIKSGTTYVIAPDDDSKVLTFTGSSSIDVGVNINSLTNVGEIAEVEQYGTGAITISAGTATLRVNSNSTLVADGQYSRIAIQKMTSGGEYRVFGELTPA
jgi:hypothetical protein